MKHCGCETVLEPMHSHVEFFSTDVTLASSHAASIHMHSDPPAELHARFLPPLFLSKWEKPHAKNILKASHTQGYPGDKSRLPLYWWMDHSFP